MSRRPFVVVAMAMVFVAMAVGVAGAATVPYDTNAECLECHQGGIAVSQVDFTHTGSVDRTTVCKKCHWEPAGGHPFHGTSASGVTWSCGSCHAGWGATNISAIPRVNTAYGYFFSAASAVADSATLHVIHANPGWAASASKNGRMCASCHAAAACTACHEGSLDPTHVDHTYDAGLGGYWPSYGPSALPMGSGTPAGNEYTNNLNYDLGCSNGTCHDISSGASDPYLWDDTSAGITYTGTWSRSSQSGYFNNTFRVANAVGASAEYSFSGQKVEFLSVRGPSCGYVKVYIDNVEQANLSLYWPTLEKQFIAYSSDTLSSGTHTIKIVVQGTKEAASRAAFIYLDAFQVFPRLTSTATSCTTCHSAATDFMGMDRAQSHGAPETSHTPVASAYCTQAGCHTSYTNIANGHGAKGDTCNTCHENSVLVDVGHEPYKFKTGVTRECQTCHNNTRADLGTKTNNPFDYTVPHGGRHVLDLTGSNYADGAGQGVEAGCTNAGAGCHGSSQTSTNVVDYHPVTGNSCTGGKCHTSAQNEGFAVNEPYLCADCHSGSYQYGLDADPLPSAHYMDATHTATGGLGNVKTQGGSTVAACSACHDLTLDSAHTNIASATKGTKVTCSECHNYSVQIVLEVRNPTSWTNNACSDCHTAGAGYATVQHAADVPLVVNATSYAGCGGTGVNCHDSIDLHAIHKGNGGSDPACSVAGCHDATHKNVRPTEKSCGQATGCHTSPTYTAANHKGLTGSESPTHTAGAIQANDTDFLLCDQCHDMALGSEHARTYSTVSGSGTLCQKCHNNAGSTSAIQGGWASNRNSTVACAQCHDGSGIATQHGNFGAGHLVASAGCSSTGGGCHTNNSIIAPHSGGCLRCHSETASPGYGTYDPNKNTCGAGNDCHATTDPADLPTTHYASTDHTATSLATSVTAGAGGTLSARCNQCHNPTLTSPNQLLAQHTNINGSTSVTCAGCHNYSATISSIVKNSWSTDTCAECHSAANMPGESQHATAPAPSVLGTVTLGNTAADECGSCHSAWNLHEIHKGSVTSTTTLKTQGCAVVDAAAGKGCHDYTKQAFSPTVKACGQGNGGCHLTKTDSNHGGRHQLDIAGSNYAETNGDGVESGCTNGGSGCHGPAATTNIVDYHVDKTLCYSGKCHLSSQNEGFAVNEPYLCADCHAGTYQYGPTATPLPSLYPAGHYGETSHTASTGLGNVKVQSGTTVATCSACHDLKLAPAHTNIASTSKGTKVTCSECHNYNAGVTDEVKTQHWSNNACSDCHNATDMPTVVMHAADVLTAVSAGTSTGCGATGRNCHNSNDLHELHKGNGGADPGCNVTDCHDAAHKNIKPTMKDCGQATGCHTSASYLPQNHKALTGNETTHTTGALQGTTATFASTPCQSCHWMNVGREHTLTTTYLPGSGTFCQNCHNRQASDAAIASTFYAARIANNATECGTCHGVTNGGDTIPARHADAGSTAHTKALNQTAGCGASGTGCHNSNDMSLVGATNVVNANIHADCLTCHDKNGATSYLGNNSNLVYSPSIYQCGQAGGCHTSAQYTAAQHNGYGGPATGTDAVHHEASATAMASTITTGSISVACSVCHSSQLLTAHTNAAPANTCAGCHNNTGAAGDLIHADDVVKDSWQPRTCGECHGSHGNAYHDTYGTLHLGDDGANTCVSRNCHATYDLVTLHKNKAGGCQFSGCHTTINVRPTQKGCGTAGSGTPCHNTYTNSAGHLKNTSSTTANESTHTAGANQGADTTFYSTACSACHNMTLGSEHTLTTTYLPGAGTTFCEKCHNRAASDAAIGAPGTGGTWRTARTGNTTTACATCHGVTNAGDTIPARHTDASSTAHTKAANATVGCGASGAGCHPTNDYSQVGARTTANNIHLDCLTCHDKTGSATYAGNNSNMRYQTTYTLCGAATGCHPNTLYNTSTFVHNNTGYAGAGLADGNDATHHTAIVTSSTYSGEFAADNQACGNCHDAALQTAHGATVSVPKDCKGCHNSTQWTSASPAQVKANWANDKCTDCHTNTLVHTTNTAAAHTSPDGAGCTTASCHGNTDDLKVIHDKVDLAHTPPYNSCYNANTARDGAGAECHSVKNHKPSVKTCGTGQGGCHLDKTTINHSAAHTLGASTYSTATVSGCTGAGIGCHGAALTTYADTQYHPVAGVACGTSKCHDGTATNHDNTLFDDPNTCQDCHGQGTSNPTTWYVNAPKVSALTSTTANNGHYGVATHTVSAVSMTTSLTAGGTASARCEQCHLGAGTNGLTGLYAYHQFIGGTAPQATGPGFADAFESGNFNNWTSAEYRPAATGFTTNFTDGFETANFATVWNTTGSGGTLPARTTAGTPTGAGTAHALILGERNRTNQFATTNAMNLNSANRAISFMWKAVRTSGSPTLYAEMSTDGTNYTYAGWDSGAIGASTSYATVNIPQANIPQSTTVYLRFRVVGGTANPTATSFYIDQVSCTASVATVTENGWTVQTGAPRNGAYSARAIGSPDSPAARYLTKTGIVNQPASSVNLTFNIAYNNIVANELAVETYDGSTWTQRATYTGTQATLSAKSISVPANTVGVRFMLNSNLASHTMFVDDVALTPVPAVGSGGTSWSCAGCHNNSAKAISLTQRGGTAYNKTCNTCHNSTDMPSYAEQHSASIPVTAGAWSGTKNCSTCHSMANLHTLHQDAASCSLVDGTTGKGCHDLNKQALKPVYKTCGSTGDCHTGTHPPIPHDASLANGTSGGTFTYGYGTNDGCFGTSNTVGCHFRDLMYEHGTAAFLTANGVVAPPTVAGRTMNGTIGGSTDGCSVCHTDRGTAGQYANSTNVVTAMANGDMRCTSCHNQAADNATGVRAPHTTTEILASASMGTTYEWGTAGAGVGGAGHNSFGVSFPKTTGFGTVNTVAVTSPWPFGGTLVSPWTTSSVVKCSDCHNAPASAPNGPQGAAVTYYIDGTATVSNWAHTQLTGDTQAAMPALCARCHLTLSAGVHGRSAHNANGLQCRSCHIEIPHAWKRPRLLRRSYTDANNPNPDTAPYLDTANDIAGNAWIGGIIVSANPVPVQGNCVSEGACSANHQSGAGNRLWP